MNQIILHSYQLKAALELTKQYPLYRQNPLLDHRSPIPYLKFLSSVTGSGKTAILVQTLANLLSYYSSVQPLIFWLSCNKVIVQQTLHNLEGKYRPLLPSVQVKSFLEISSSDIAQLSTPIIYVDTVQKFSVQNKETRQIYQIQLDKADKSPWQLIQQRQDYSSHKTRDLIIFYDEGHNLTDAQVEKILELTPQILILASGTPSLPHRLTNFKQILEDHDYSPLYSIPFQAVKAKNMVKGKLVLGGYQSQMEEVINEMLDTDWKKLCSAALKENLPLPKIIYVCKTNILAGKSGKRDNPQLPFNQRNAPPILIWRHLVNQKQIDPATIAIYADIAVAKEEKYALDWKFRQNLFNKGKSSPKENTYEKFVQGNYQHIIFNKSLAEGWDDPLIYLAYIDKTMGSEIAVEQIIGRVLRQPNCRYYESEVLNKAYFHIRLDENKVFKKIIEELNEKLAIPASDLEIRDKTGSLSYLIDVPAKKSNKLVPQLTWDSEYIQRKLQRIVNAIPNYAKDFPLSYRQNIGKVQRSEYGLGDPRLIQVPIWVEDFGLTNMVPAQVILRRTIIEKNTKVWNMLEWEDPKFKVLIGWGSKADEELKQTGAELVRIYLTESILKISLEKPYEVRGIKVERNEKRQQHFKNALHEKYSQLNNLELRTAHVLDGLELDWCRNPAHYGYGIELLDEMGLTQSFFPDFLLWVSEDKVVCLEVTGEHLERDKLERKLVRIAEPEEELLEEAPKQVQVVILIQYGGKKQKQEIYYKVWWRKKRGGVKSMRVESIREGVEVILGDL